MNHGEITPAIAKGLLELRSRIESGRIPSSKIDETLNIATWNIRQFGKSPRSEAAIHYIAEILGQFDLIGIVELNANLGDLRRVLNILGPYWRAVYTDAQLDHPGNDERIGFIYDRRAVTFNGLAAEASEPRAKTGTTYLPTETFWRTPYMASFRSGNYDFVVMAVHVRWAKVESDRLPEMDLLANWIKAKHDDRHREDEDLIVMGDFNIPSRKSKLFKSITQFGLQIPTPLMDRDVGSNLERNKRYDQILYYSGAQGLKALSGGILDFHIDDEHIDGLFDPRITRPRYIEEMSDHLPLWIQIDTDNDNYVLNQIIQAG
jgi:endonuclease/exonuclease/phosphatase family metal-dependent hydrolase